MTRAMGFFVALMLGGCPKKTPPPAPAAEEHDASVATQELDASVDLDAETAERFDAWVPEHPTITLKPDWENRYNYNDAPRFVYEAVGIPAIAPDGQRIVVTGMEYDHSNLPSFRIVTLRLDDREESASTIQSEREFHDALYPPNVDFPTPEITDPIFRTLIKSVNKRLLDVNATLVHHQPLPPCRLEPQDEAGIRLHATCVGLSVTYEQHHLHVVGRGGHVRLDRSVASWKRTAPIPGLTGVKDEVRAIYGDASHNVLVFEIETIAQQSYLFISPKWHVIKLGP
jgi:hypothetical protein